MMGDKIYYATETAVSLLNLMHKDDHVSIVTFNQSSHVIFPSRKLSREARDVFIEQIQQPALDEQSDLSAGWLTGVEQVLDHKTEDTLNWVLLFTDGRGDAGLTDQDELTAKAKDLQQQGINTYTFGVGDDADQPLLQAVAEAGGGKFYFIEQPDKSPNYLQNWLKQFGATMQTGHSAVVELTVPDNIQVTLLQPISHTKQLGNFRISLGEIFALQHHHIPLMLQLPPYPAGQHIYLPVALHYNDAQSLMPIVARTIPLCFTVVDSVRQKKEASKASETLTPPPVQSLQPASRLWWTNPVFAVLSGGILFLMTALLAVGTLLLVSTKSEPAAVVDDTANQPVVVEEEEEDTEIILPKPTETETPVSATDTPESTGITTGRDEIILPTKTPTPQPTPTPTATYVPQTAQPVEGLQVGNLAPDFTLGSTRDTRVSLSELQGKIVILNFWASWCGYCTIEVPALESIHNEYGPQGVVVLAVNQGENLQTVERFAWNNGIHFTVWLDEDAWAGNIYQVRGIPTTYFIDREGIIQAVHPGTRTREQFVAELEKLLE
jgi:peroxiredoxin